MPQRVINNIDKCGENAKNTVYGNHLEFRNHTKEIYAWDNEESLCGLIEYETWRNHELYTDFPVVITEDGLLGPMPAIDYKTIDNNVISAAAAAAKSGILHTLGVWYGNGYPLHTPKSNNSTPDREGSDDEKNQ